MDLPPGDLRQPDGTSCGPSCIVVARMLADPRYAATVTAAFAAEVRATHRSLTGRRDAAGRTQLPWPPALGTPPWAVAHALEDDGTRRRIHQVRLGRDAGFERLHAAVSGGGLVPLYIGSRLLPRHVVLVLSVEGTALAAYDPVTGALRPIEPGAFVAGRLGIDGWDLPWFAITPR